jgi:hypothetical protein
VVRVAIIAAADVGRPGIDPDAAPTFDEHLRDAVRDLAELTDFTES